MGFIGIYGIYNVEMLIYWDLWEKPWENAD